MEKEKVLVAMSGGIDSSVAAILLMEQGFDVVGITLKTWDFSSTCHTGKETGCCSIDSFNDARNIAVSLGFPHYVINVQQEFEEKIISNFIDEYIAGRTPNPCVLCNTHIKWDFLLKKADSLGCKYIATGHYAQIKNENNRFFVSKGVDEIKDQSYVLWGLTQENLNRTLLPLGKYQKNEIREIAKNRGFETLAKKSESYEICFIPDNEYRNFLKLRRPDLEEKVANGNFVMADGKIIGKHKGYPFYTIGQRKGLDIALGYPAFVIDIIPETNTVVIGTRDDLNKSTMTISQVNCMKYSEIPENSEFLTKIRYKDAGTLANFKKVEDSYVVTFSASVSAITKGQSAVIYEGNDVVAGGLITNIL